MLDHGPGSGLGQVFPTTGELEAPFWVSFSLSSSSWEYSMFSCILNAYAYAYVSHFACFLVNINFLWHVFCVQIGPFFFELFYYEFKIIF